MTRNFHFSLLLCLIVAGSTSAEPPPNIVVLLADDLGWKDVGFHGSEIRTPHLDELAAAGTELANFYVQPVCSPTRGALLSSKYPMRLGLQCGVVRPWAQHGLAPDERTLAEVLRDAGYRTAICGKWHLGHHEPEYLPHGQGFDHQYGHYNGALDYWTHIRDGGLDWHRNQQPLREEGYTTELIGREASRVIAQHDFQQPLFLYVPFNAPHTPLQAPEELIESYASIKQRNRRIFAAMVSSMDDAIGSIVKSLKERNQFDRTIIFFASDNGGPEGKGGADNGPLRDGKGTLYEGGVHVPALVCWPDTLEGGGKVEGMMHIVDLMPTLVAAAKLAAELPSGIDGVNQWPVIQGKVESVRTEVLLNSTPFHGAVRQGDWKLVRNGKVRANSTSSPPQDTLELFNLADDPAEENDLSAKSPEKLKAMVELLSRYQAQAVPPNIPPNRPPTGFQVPEVW